MFSIFFTTSTVIVIVLIVVQKWLLAEGSLKEVYWLGVAIPATYSVINIATAIAKPELWASSLYVFLQIYAIAMSIKGLNRLKKECEIEDGRIVQEP